MNKATNKSTTERKTFAYKGPTLWGVKRVNVAGRGAGNLLGCSCDWVRSERWCSVELDSGETVVVEGGELSVIS